MRGIDKVIGRNFRQAFNKLFCVVLFTSNKLTNGKSSLCKIFSVRIGCPWGSGNSTLPKDQKKEYCNYSKTTLFKAVIQNDRDLWKRLTPYLVYTSNGIYSNVIHWTVITYLFGYHFSHISVNHDGSFTVRGWKHGVYTYAQSPNVIFSTS